MNLNEIKNIIDYISEKTNLSEVSIETRKVKIYISKNNNIQKKNDPLHHNSSKANNNNDLLEIKSPMVGIFYRKPNPESKNFVEIGQDIKKNDDLCIIESMKVFNTLKSDTDGKIIDIMVDNSQPVEYGQTLFIVKNN